MNAKRFFHALTVAFLLLQGCGGVTPVVTEKPPIPLQKANQELILAENEGLRVVWEDAKDARDFYRGGVQQKNAGEKRFLEKAYPQALKAYESSNDFFTKTLQYLSEDTAEYSLYEGTDILLFPNLLMADNYVKMGRIQRDQGHESTAQSSWKKAQSFIQKSLQSEKTEWGQSLEKEVADLAGSKNK